MPHSDRHPARIRSAYRLVGLLLVVGAVCAPTHASADSRGLPKAPVAQPPICSPEWIAGARSGAWSSAESPDVMQPPTGPGSFDAVDRTKLGRSAARRAPQPGGGRRSLLPRDGLDAPSAVVGLSSKFPNDTYFLSHQRYSLWKIGAPEAWAISYGGPDATVAIVSSGVDYTHEDLASKIWRNRAEIPGNGIDDDANGYIDDVIGWDFAENDSDPMDFEVGVRGTMLAGIVAAATNNAQGIAGVSWHARLMPLKVLRQYELPSGKKYAAGEDEDVIEAVCYAVNNGADAILLAPTLYDPLLVTDTMDRMRVAIDYAHQAGAVVVAPAGDCGGDPWADGRPWCPDPDKYGDSNGENPVIFPANFPNVVGVQSVTRNTQLRPEASWGPWVDITAPGEDFQTTNFGGNYRYVQFYEPNSGGWRAVSDFAAAHVAGVVAVMRTVDPLLSPHRILEGLCMHATKPPGEEFDQDAGSWRRNDRYGCGVLSFEHTIEGIGWRVHGVQPAALTLMTDGNVPALENHFENLYLNDGAWAVYSGKDWLKSDSAGQSQGGSSRVRLTTDIDVLKAQVNRIVGMTFTDTLLACPVGSVNQADRSYCANDCRDQRCPCQCIDYRLKVVAELHRLYLPQSAASR